MEGEATKNVLVTVTPLEDKARVGETGWEREGGREREREGGGERERVSGRVWKK